MTKQIQSKNILRICFILAISISIICIISNYNQKNNTYAATNEKIGPKIYIKAITDDGSYFAWHYQKQLYFDPEDNLCYIPDIKDPMKIMSGIPGYKFDHYYLSNSLYKVTKITKTDKNNNVTKDLQKEKIPYKNTINSLARQTSETLAPDGTKIKTEIKYAVYNTKEPVLGYRAVFIKDPDNPAPYKTEHYSMKRYPLENEGKTLTAFSIDNTDYPLNSLNYTDNFLYAIHKLSRLYLNLGINVQYHDERETWDSLLTPCKKGYQMANCSDFTSDFIEYLTGAKTPKLTKLFPDYVKQVKEKDPSIVRLDMHKNEVQQNVKQNTLITKLVKTLKPGDLVMVSRNNNNGHALIITDFVKNTDGDVIDLKIINCTGRQFDFDKKGAIQETTISKLFSTKPYNAIENKDDVYTTYIGAIALINDNRVIYNTDTFDTVPTNGYGYLVTKCDSEVTPIYKKPVDNKVNYNVSDIPETGGNIIQIIVIGISFTTLGLITYKYTKKKRA